MTRHAVLPRRGAMMFVALAALATVAAIAAAMLSGALAGRRQLRAERDSLQVEQLLDLATREARARGAAGHGADGMRVVPADAIVGSGSARITTTVAPGGDGAVRVVVEYPLEGPVTIRRTREVTVPVPARSPSHEEQSP
jgi:type II secretory pathway pseudopilin PulG